MDISTLLWSFAIGLLLVGILVLVYIGIQDLRHRPNASNLLNVLEPLAYQGMLAALMIAQKGTDDLLVELDGWDKAAIANAAYDLIPDSVVLYGKQIPLNIVKQLVPRATFVEFVKTKYDSFRAWELQHEQHFINQVAKLKDAPNATYPGDQPPPAPKTVQVNPAVDEAGLGG